MKHVTAALVANGYPKRFVIDVGKPKRLAQQLHRMLQRVSVFKKNCIYIALYLVILKALYKI